MLTAEDRQKIRYLNQYQIIIKSISRKLLHAEEIRSIAEKCTPILSLTSGGSPDPHNREKSITELVDIAKDIDADIKQLRVFKEEIENVISKVENPAYKEILELRYINGMKFEEILIHTNRRSWSTLIRTHHKAIREVELAQ